MYHRKVREDIREFQKWQKKKKKFFVIVKHNAENERTINLRENSKF